MNNAQYLTLFTDLGRLISYTNGYLVLQDEQDADLQGLLTLFGDDPNLERGLITAYDGIKSGAAGFISTLIERANIILGEYQQTLLSPSSDALTMWDYIINDMREESQTVQSNEITDPAIVANGNNVGNGTLIADLTVPDSFHQLDVIGTLDERVIDEDVEFFCQADRHTGTGAAEEQFSITGFSETDVTTNDTRGNGISTITPIDNIILNGSFQEFDDDGFINWTQDAGTFSSTPAATTTAGTTAGITFANLSPVTDPVYIGTYSSMWQAGNTDEVQISQSIDLDVDKLYVATFRMFRDRNMEDGSTFGMYLVGEGFTETLIELNPADIPLNEWTLYNVFYILPEDPPDDLEIVLLWSNMEGIVTRPERFFLDQVITSETTEFGHVSYALIPGNINYIRGDKIISTSDSNFEGIIQSWVNRFYDKLLPSNIDVTGPPTIGDELVTGEPT